MGKVVPVRIRVTRANGRAPTRITMERVTFWDTERSGSVHRVLLLNI